MRSKRLGPCHPSLHENDHRAHLLFPVSAKISNFLLRQIEGEGRVVPLYDVFVDQHVGYRGSTERSVVVVVGRQAVSRCKCTDFFDLHHGCTSCLYCCDMFDTEECPIIWMLS